MSEKAMLTVGGQTLELPIVEGTEKEKAIDISPLRAKTGYITLDPAFMNTGSCTSSITFIDGELGILKYRGIPIEVLAEKANFLETAHLLLWGKLPTQTQLDTFAQDIRHESMLDEDLKNIFRGFSREGHPMAIMGAMMFALSARYEEEERDPTTISYLDIVRLISKVPTILAFIYKRSVGQPYVYPQTALDYVSNFLHMMFSLPIEQYQVSPELHHALNLLLVLHADHEQNCSTSAVRMARSSTANVYTCIAAGIGALWGARHGGANQEVIEMLQAIHAEGGDVKGYVAKVKDKKSQIKLMGFGHRVYKNFDPRAKIIKLACDALLTKLKIKDPLLAIAHELEDAALHDPYFVERKLYPNVDFYSGIMYKTIGIPVPAFPAMFAFGRLPGWLAQAKEFTEDPANKIARPRQIYQGPANMEYTPVTERK